MALAVISVQLYDKDGGAIQVSDPIHVSVPLPSDTHNRMATSVPVWLYQPQTGEFGPGSSPLFSVRRSNEHVCRTLGEERDGLHPKRWITVCLERHGGSDGILAGCFPFIHR